MDRKAVWILAGAIVRGFSIFGVTQLSAQRPQPGDGPPRDGPPPGGAPARFQVVRATPDVIILLDTTTGDLYNAVPSDIKPYNARTRGGFGRGPDGGERGRPPVDGPKDGQVRKDPRRDAR